MPIIISTNGKIEYILSNKQDAINIIQSYQREDDVNFEVDWGDNLSPSEEEWSKEFNNEKLIDDNEYRYYLSLF